MAKTVGEEVFRKPFKGSQDDIRTKPDYLVIEEHIETEKLQAEPIGSKKDDPFITCGTLIIRKQDSDSKQKPISRSSSRSTSKESKKPKSFEKQELSNTDEKQLIRDSYQMLQEMLQNKMATVSAEMKEKSKSCSPYPTKTEKSTGSAPDNNIELDVDINAEINHNSNSEDNLFPDFSVSVMKFQDAIESFSHAIFDDVDDSCNENQVSTQEKSINNDHAGATVHKRYHELVGPGMLNETSASKIEAEVIEEPMIEKFATQLQANHDVIEDILNSIDPVVITDPNLVTQYRVPVIEEAFNAESDKKLEGFRDEDTAFCRSPKMDHKLEDLAQKILIDSKSELCLVPNQKDVKKETLNVTQLIPEICVTNDSTDSQSPAESCSKPTWISIPIIRGHSMPEQTASQVSIQELSDSETIEGSNQHSPVITEGIEHIVSNGRKISEPVKTNIQIQELEENSSKNSKVAESKIPDVHIAFSRHVEDMHEEAGAFVPVVCEGEVSQVTDPIENYKKAQISIEETLKYDEELKDVCEYHIQPKQECLPYQVNKAKECESKAELLNLNNLSEKNLDTNESRSETNIEVVNMKAMNRSKYSSTLQEHEVKNSNLISETNSEHKNLSQGVENKSQAVTSYNTQTRKQDVPVVGWLKAFAMVVTGAIIVTYCLIPSDDSSQIEATGDEHGNHDPGCSADGYVGLSHINYQQM